MRLSEAVRRRASANGRNTHLVATLGVLAFLLSVEPPLQGCVPPGPADRKRAAHEQRPALRTFAISASSTRADLTRHLGPEKQGFMELRSGLLIVGYGPITRAKFCIGGRTVHFTIGEGGPFKCRASFRDAGSSDKIEELEIVRLSAPGEVWYIDYARGRVRVVGSPMLPVLAGEAQTGP